MPDSKQRKITKRKKQNKINPTKTFLFGLLQNVLLPSDLSNIIFMYVDSISQRIAWILDSSRGLVLNILKDRLTLDTHKYQFQTVSENKSHLEKIKKKIDFKICSEDGLQEWFIHLIDGSQSYCHLLCTVYGIGG